MWHYGLSLAFLYLRTWLFTNAYFASLLPVVLYFIHKPSFSSWTQCCSNNHQLPYVCTSGWYEISCFNNVLNALLLLILVFFFLLVIILVLNTGFWRVFCFCNYYLPACLFRVCLYNKIILGWWDLLLCHKCNALWMYKLYFPSLSSIILHNFYTHLILLGKWEIVETIY